jgi:hypothetical protein
MTAFVWLLIAGVKKKVYSKDSFKGYLGIGLPSIILNIGSFYTQEAFIRGIP